ncbi:solute carrier family 52, riboflavin transporter, member 3-A-like [Vespa mandarinia]|uniref:solute carrier family 52, riboflavin transporter, member 3-A-like n=1 Tax=Vespa mandarinia TaxID=7446 RepID=UPI001616F7DE|nr:solute carrier family 52, riboflavin transporter, member 3-A-like [Vespa mandarinia]
MTTINIKEYLKNRSSYMHLLIVLFGISAWIGVNGIFVQLPILIHCSPEGSALPTYIVIAIQMANVGPIIYTFLQQMQIKINEFLSILGILIIGNISMALLIFFYNRTVVISNSEYSLALFVLTFFTALVGCFSSVLFMPYLRNFKKTYMTSYFIGEGLSGVLPSLVSLMQDIGENTECVTNSNITSKEIISNFRFSPLYYFLFIFLVLFLSLIAFIILQYFSFHDIKQNYQENKNSQDKIQVTHYNIKDKPIFASNNLCLENDQTIKHSLSNDESKNAKCLKVDYEMSIYKKLYLLILMSFLCFFGNGFLPSIQSYSSLPYGNITYQLSVTLSQFANPIACFITFWIIPSNLNIIHSLSTIILILCSYVTYVALMSPFVPLQESKIGVIIILISWTILIGLISYVKLIIISIFRQVQKENILFYVGIIMQGGSASGAIISFTLINFTDLFHT